MNDSIRDLLQRLWLAKKEVTAEGEVRWSPSAEAARRELLQACRKVDSLLVVRLDAIGDAFMFQDGMRRVRELFPNARLTLLAYAETKPIYSRCPCVDQSIYIEREPFAANKAYRENTFAELRNTGTSWDVALNPLYSREYGADELMMMVPAEIKIGIAGDFSNISRDLRAVTDTWYSCLLPTDSAQTLHELHRHHEILQLLGSESPPQPLKAPILDEERRLVSDFLKNQGLQSFGVVFPGTKGALNSIKYWGSDNYASLIDHLQLDRDCEAIMLGGPGEEAIASEITALARSVPLVLQGELSLWQSAALLEKARFYVGSDTSMAHVAAALGIPTYVLLGGGHYGRFFPYPQAKNVHCISKKLECFNCNWKCTQSYNQCIADISVQQVASALEPELAKAPAAFPAEPGEWRINIATLKNSRPRIDLVLPPGPQSWQIKEGWAFTLRKSGCLHRVFRPTAESHSHLISYLRSGGSSDLILALGGDHHLGFLHDTEEKQEAWQQFRGLRVCNSFESTRDALYKKYVPRLRTALKCFTHFAFTDEVDQKIFDEAGVPALWWPQATDSRFFARQIPFEARRQQVFFCGKVWDEYPLRRALLNGLQEAQLSHTVSRVATGDLVAHYNRFAFAINLPGVLGGFNARTYEAMSCGSLLFQFRPSNRPLNNSLFKDGVHFLLFDPTNVEGLRTLVQKTIEQPQLASAIAQRGHEEVLVHHTMERRLEQLIEWAFGHTTPDYLAGNPASQQNSETQERAYVNDRYLFDGRPIDNPESLNQFADLQFLPYRNLVAKVCRQGEDMAAGGDDAQALRLFKQAVSSDSDAPQAHNNLGVMYWNRGERHRAFRHFEAALLEDPQYRPAVINFGEALQIAGDKSRAHELYSRFLQYSGDDATVQTLLQAMQ